MFRFWAKLIKLLREFTYIAPKICVDLPMVQGKCGRTAILVNNLIDNMVILLFFGTSLDSFFFCNLDTLLRVWQIAMRKAATMIRKKKIHVHLLEWFEPH